MPCHMMEKVRYFTTVAVAVAAASALVGCGESVAGHQAKSPTGREMVFVAPGVNLVLDDAAGPEARRIAEEIERAYSSALISARPAIDRRWGGAP